MLKKAIPPVMKQSKNMIAMFGKKSKACGRHWARVGDMVHGVDTADVGAMKAALHGMGIKVKGFHLGKNPEIMRGTKLKLKCKGCNNHTGVGYGGIFLR